ncbi:leucine-rich repeat-containing protein 46 [Octodon degus]|uniref:Leucine-rich repeat-containing protein 46 n=1 Tax=Octodon degus TaxID=10160 RepID=A0A6P3FAV1_OCTDE|nr:leucine-rich repeat-containing protein 46 [Octodon degus]XP_023573975.1 leucine-rich repeat-containing protein 46 [Octodon degus]
MMSADELAQSPGEGVCITEALIIKRNLSFREDEDLSEKMFHTLADLHTVRLDREGITMIRNLEGLQNIHSLYLQENKIQRIQNLACIPSLRFLSLAGNHIRQVENLLTLPYLQFLDLSENLIDSLMLDELPQSLLILNLTGNKCTTRKGYREMVIAALPLLLDLDKQPVAERWTSDEEDQASEGEDELPELSGPFCSERGFFRELSQELSGHQARRQQAALTEHLLRMEMQPGITELSPATMAGDSSPSVTPEHGGEPRPAPVPQASSPTTKPNVQALSVQARKGTQATLTLGTSVVRVPSTNKTTTKRAKN